MPRVLHLYNTLGAETEQSWLDYPLKLVSNGWDAVLGYESLACEKNGFSVPTVQLQRVNVEQTDDVVSQLDTLGTDVSDDALRNLLNEPFDLIHGHFGPRLLQGAAWLKRDVPMIVSLYGYDASRLLRDPCWAARYRWAASHGVMFVVLCEFMRNQLIDCGIPHESIRIIPLGIDLDYWKYEPHIMPEHPRFVFVGRLTEKKDPIGLLDALQILREKYNFKPRFDIIGDGPLNLQVSESIAKNNLAEQVTMHGNLTRKEVGKQLAGATALVLPSTVASDGDCEGTPVVLMEAQAIGVPCITTKHSGNPEVLPKESHDYVVPERDPKSLADALHRISTVTASEYRKLQDSGRNWIEERYDIRLTVERYHLLYEELTGRKCSKLRSTPAGIAVSGS